MKHLFQRLRPRPSTLAFYREARRSPIFSLKEFIHGYIYARWPYLYISMGIRAEDRRLLKRLQPLADFLLWWWLRKPRIPARNNATISKRPLPLPGTSVKNSFAESYHGKVLLPEAARKLLTVDRNISLRHLETVVPYSHARDLILKHPDHIVLLNCPCRSVRPNPCLPLDVCLVVGEPFAGFIAEHHPGKSRWISQAEALEVLQAAGQRGNVHHAFFKDAMLGRFYAICNCCACCCGAMQAYRNGLPMLASSGYVARVDSQRCVACGSCADICQFEAIVPVEGFAAVDALKCMGCGSCVSVCAAEALSLERVPERGDPLDLETVLAAAAARDRSACDKVA